MAKIKNYGKRGLSLLLVLVMCLGMLGTSAFAVDEPVDADVIADVETVENAPVEKTEVEEPKDDEIKIEETEIEEPEDDETKVEEIKVEAPVIVETPVTKAPAYVETEADALPDEVLELRDLMDKLDAFDLDTLDEDNIDEFQAMGDRLGELSEIVFDGDYYDGMMDDMLRFQALAEKLTGGVNMTARDYTATVVAVTVDGNNKVIAINPFDSKNASLNTVETNNTSGVSNGWTWSANGKGYTISAANTKTNVNCYPAMVHPSKLWVNTTTYKGFGWSSWSPSVGSSVTINNTETYDWKYGNSTASYVSKQTAPVTNATGTYIYYVFSAPTYSYTLDYNANGGVDGSVTQNKVTNQTAESYTFNSFNGNPTKQGYRLAGWSTTSGENNSANKVTSITATKASNTKTVYAIWEPIDYTITYTDGVSEKEVFADQKSTKHYGDATPAFSGDTSTLTYTDSNGVTWEFKEWSPTVAKTVTGSQIYEAQWQKKFTVTWLDGDDEQMKKMSFPEGTESEVYRSEDPMPPGDGHWKEDKPDPITGNIIIRWDPDCTYYYIKHVYLTNESNKDGETEESVTGKHIGDDIKLYINDPKSSDITRVYTYQKVDENGDKVEYDYLFTTFNTGSTLDVYDAVKGSTACETGDWTYSLQPEDKNVIVLWYNYIEHTHNSKPYAPTNDEVDGVLGNVVVKCQPGKHADAEYIYTVDSNGDDYTDRISIGTVDGNDQQGYTCTVTFLAAKFADAYNKTNSGHTLVSGEGDKTVTFKFDDDNGEWKLDANQPTQVIFLVTCDEAKEPVAENVMKFSKTFAGLDEIPDGFSIDWTVSTKDITTKASYSETRVLTIENPASVDDNTNTVTWEVPLYHTSNPANNNVDVNRVTVVEHCDVDEYTYTTTAAQDGWSVNDETHTISFTYARNTSVTACSITNNYALASTDNGGGVSLTKTRTSAETAKKGDVITWNITVTNNSNVDKTVTLTEMLPGAALSEYSVDLEAGESKTVTAEYLVTGKETLTDGKFFNTVKADTGDNGSKETPEAKDEGTKITITVTWLDGYTETPLKIKDDVKKGITQQELNGYYPDDPTRDDYDFTVWGEPESDADGNLTITAQWKSKNQPPVNPKLTRFTKERVTDAETIEKLGLNLTDINTESTVMLGKDEKATLLYKITVTGELGAKYLVTELKGANLVPGYSWDGTIDSTGSAVIYVTMTFTRDNIEDGKVVNTASVKPGDGTVIEDPDDPDDPKLTDEVESGAGRKQYKVTVNFWTDDNPREKLDDSIVTAPIDDGGDYSFEVEGLAAAYSMRSVSLPSVIEKDGKTYVLDEVESADALKNLSGTIDGKDEVIDLIYSLDEKGNPDDPDNKGDGIPDKYQVKVTFVVKNGAWNDETKANVVVYLEKTNAEGVMDANGTATLGDIPAVGDKPDDGYKAGDWGSNEPKADDVIDKDTVYTYTYKLEPKTPYTVTWKDENGNTVKTDETEDNNVPKELYPVESDENYPTSEGDWGKPVVDEDAKTITITWEPTTTPDPETVTVKFDSRGGSAVDDQTMDSGKTATKPTDPTRTGYTFTGWTLNGVAYDFNTPVTENITLVAGWTPAGGTGGNPNPPAPPTGGGGDPDEIEIDDPDVPLAGDLELNRVDHFAYVFGYTDGTVRPLSNITREEVAVIFYRLLTDTARAIFNSESNDFSDVADTRWSNREISTLANAGIITGYADGTFRPSQYITRAEFAAIAARFEDVTDGLESPFSDTAGHWAENLIAYSANRGWVTGYADGTFRPNQAITRAESMTLINNVLARHVDEEGIHADAKQWPDNASDSWYYFAVLEATNSHDYERRTEDGTVENWTEVTDKTNIN